jgi:hypothetical protein
MPPRRRVWFLLGGVVSSSILRGDSEAERLLEEVVDDGLDDDDPSFFGEKACRSLPWLQHSLHHKYKSGVFNRYKVHQYYCGVWTLSGLRM